MQHVYIAGQSSYCEATFSHFTLLEKTYVVLRFVYLSILFSPSAILYGISRLFRSSKLESVAWSYTMRALQTAGPAFVKLGQWASTRRDIFSEEFCNSLSQLHSCCHSHQWQDTRRTLEEEFGHDWENILEIADQEPIGSGCVAQVYKGYLKTVKAAETSDLSQGCSESTEKQTTNSLFSRLTHTLSKKSRQRERVEPEVAEGPTPVAVKVLHPGTVQAMERDMLLMRYGAYWMDWLNPHCHWVALKECFTEFASVMRRQLDMELEARNLQRFQEKLGSNYCVKFPTPLFPYVTKRVLVETFEAGSHISRYMDNPGGELQKTLARIGTDTLLDMVSTVCAVWCTTEEVAQMQQLHHVHRRVTRDTPMQPPQLAKSAVCL
jgi:aarF domain-containing kinase